MPIDDSAETTAQFGTMDRRPSASLLWYSNRRLGRLQLDPQVTVSRGNQWKTVPATGI
ncbi:hypothetical protein [Pseudonocardia sp. UM4_GMWB1]|uniref:hypothetical protein n=1 Tax=Pseudonocardia sp. UM4_GMWB1 TaxID=2212989 RepID=UPI00307FB3C9